MRAVEVVPYGPGRVALVTGSTSGIGKGIAQRLVQDSFTIAFHSKSSIEVGQALAATYAGASYTQADLSDLRQKVRSRNEFIINPNEASLITEKFKVLPYFSTTK